MTNAEFTRLEKLIKQEARTAKEDADQRGKEKRAELEARLSRKFSLEEMLGRKMRRMAKKLIAKVNAIIARRCDQLGVPKTFRPNIGLAWSSRGENADPQRRGEIRLAMTRLIEATVAQDKLRIAQEEVRQLKQLTALGLEASEAVKFLGEMPHAEELLPPVVMLQLANGEQVPLSGVTVERNTLPAERNGVTPDRNVCAVCGQAVASGRGKFCSPKCRQADYRQRKAARPQLGNEIQSPPNGLCKADALQKASGDGGG